MSTKDKGVKKLNIYEKLSYIQSKLVAPKSQYNPFGKFKYRSNEDILKAVEPLLKETDTMLLTVDKIVLIGDRYYVKAIQTLRDIETGKEYSVPAYARESLVHKGMDEAQITGAASSYARKYALNALFNIDDVKDADAQKPTDAKREKPKVNYLDQILKRLENKGFKTKEEQQKEIQRLFPSVKTLKGLKESDYQKILATLIQNGGTNGGEDK